MGPVLVFGHRHPDNDSICSAVAYAHLKNMTQTGYVHVPARLGPVPAETVWLFARFGVELPEQIDHVHTRVRDIMTEDPVCVDAGEPMLAAGRLMREKGVRALPVLREGLVKGLIDESILAGRYIEEAGLADFRSLPVRIADLVRVLEADLVVGDPATMLSGGVLIGAMEPETARGYVKPGDMMIVGDRVRTQPMALEAGVACLIVTGGTRPGDDVLDLARAKGAAVLVTEYDTYTSAKLANLCHRVDELMDPGVLLVEPDTLLSEAAEDLLASQHREAVVVEGEGEPVGILTRTNLARGLKRSVILVDHNEMSQSADGIEDASILEVVDHHRVGDVQTAGPILFLNMPVGSTATIVARRFEELGVEIPEPMAGLLLGAILSDTVLLKSPTTTSIDRDVAARLESLLGLDAAEFGMELFKARTAGRPFSAKDAVSSDMKEYRASDAIIAIAQVETVDIAEVLEHADEMQTVMESLREARGYDLVVLMVTDVVREGSEIFASGRTRLAERGLGVKFEGGSVWMPGVLSRKKQVAAGLLGVAGTQ